MEYVSTLNNLDSTDDFANNVMVEVACDKIIVDKCSDIVRGDENEVPMVGMVFDSHEDCYQYYRSYGQQKGFAVMKRNIKRGDDGLVRWVTFACSRTRTTQSSKSSLKSRPTTKTDCPAKINIVLQPDLKFKLTVANLEHNHTLSPGKSRFFRCNKRLDSHVKRRLELNDQAGIRLNKNFNSFVVEAGGYENLPFSEKDCRNYVDKARRSRLGKGDAEAIIHYFTRMQEKEVGFFFRMDLDDDSRIRNVFWVDARSRAAYEAFGDVVSFDTTYLTNKYDMPFAPFVGVNHHGHSVLLGCGLLSNEDIETFEWLFECWLSCMSWCPPKAFITDQCKAMQRAIENKFPNTRHRWCLWHIMKKIPEKLRGYSQYEAIKKSLQTCVYDSFTKNVFEKGWRDMIEKYDLHANEWLGGLYNERHRWVPIYLKDTFFAGMSTTQRSESMNAFFDGYVNSKTTLKQFVEQYDNALRSKIEKENKADYHSFNARYECVTHFQIEKQFQEAYTNAKFKEFQDELLNGKLYCTISIDNEEGSIYRYKVNEDVQLGDWSKDVVFDVYFNQRECEVQCTCQLFEFKGILCRHSLAVLTSKKVKQVPNKYILSRWRKDINRKYTLIKSSYGDLRAKLRSKSYDKMFNGLMEVAAIAEGDEERCKFVIANTCQIKEQFLSSESVRGNNQPTALVALIGSQNIENDNVELSQVSSKIRSPLATRRKGRPPVNRKVSKTEVAVKRKKRIGQKREQKMKNSGSEETLSASSMLDIHNQDGTYGIANLSSSLGDSHVFNPHVLNQTHAVGPPYTSNQSQAHLMQFRRGGHIELLLNLGNHNENPSQESINAFNSNTDLDEDGNG